MSQLFRMWPPIVFATAPPPTADVVQRSPCADVLAQQPLERVNISRLGISLTVAGLVSLAGAPRLTAQDVRADVPSTHTVKRGDTLWDIAKTYLADSYLWPAIYRLNTDQIEDPHWIYPGEVLRLPGEAAAVVADVPAAPRVVSSTTVFTPAAMAQRGPRVVEAPAAIPRIPIGDILRAPWIAPMRGPRGAGKILFGADIPGIDKARQTNNYQPYDKVLVMPPVGSVAAEREKFVSYTVRESIEDFGTVIIPTALLQVIRAPRNGEAATMQVLEVYGMINANDPIIPLDTVGAGVTARPSAVTDARTATIRAIHRNVVLPSLDYDVMFSLSSRDGMKIGDEVEIFRARESAVRDERPALPEVSIGTARVTRVTPFGTTARVTSQTQAAIQVGESIRVIARMP